MLPSDPQERQDGWYWVKAEYCSWSVALWVTPHGWMVERPGFIAEIGPRILSPDEPAPAPIERPEELKEAEGLLNLCETASQGMSDGGEHRPGPKAAAKGEK